MSSRFDRLSSEVVHEGKMISVRVERFRHEDGEEVSREKVDHPGAVGVVVHDGEQLWLVRQPREAVGSPDLLEVVAGKLDEEGEEPLNTAKRELAEEIGMAAEHWEHLKTYLSSPGFTDEEIHLFAATGLSEVDKPEVHENERITIETRPLSELDALIDEVTDGKTLVALYEFRRRRESAR